MSNIDALLDIEDKLQKVARMFNNSGKVVVEYKTKLDAVVGDVTLKKSYNFDVDDNPVGTFSKEVSWTQEMEDLVKPPITDISLVNLGVDAGLPAGTKVSDIITTGGTLPITYELTVNPDNRFRIDNNDELTLNSPSESGQYQIEIQASDDAGLVEVQQFTITVVEFVNEKSLLFDGVDEYINCGTDASLRFQRTDPFTLSAWVKLSGLGTTQIIMGNEKPTSNYPGYVMYIKPSGELSMNFINDWSNNNAIQVDASTALSTGVWYHVAMTYDGSSTGGGVSLYLNGVAESKTVNKNAISGTVPYNQNFQISGRGGANSLLSGHIDEVSVWDTSLSELDIAAIYNAGSPTDLQTHSKAANLTHWWRMGDSGQFPTIPDQVGLNNGTATNMEALDVKGDTV